MPLTFTKRETGIEELHVRIYSDGSYQLFDDSRKMGGEVVSHQEIATIPVPEEALPQGCKEAVWMWCSDFWSDTLRTETLLISYTYDE